jgi:hypothetical protein
MTHELATKRFVDALTRRDFDAMEHALAPDVKVRLLLPSRVEEIDSATAARKRIEGWFGGASRFDVMDSGDQPIGMRRRMSWRFSLVRAGGPEVIEQVAFADSDESHVTRIDLVCSGFLPEQDSAVACAVDVFDAGFMGCADGLADEFRRRIQGVPVGASLVSVVRDPAAREDLPPLARLLGHEVRSVEAGGDGTIKIVVERKR